MRSRRVGAVVLSLAMLAATGCGSQVSEADKLAAEGPIGGVAPGGPPAPGTPPGVPTPPGGGQPMFGTIPVPCGQGDAKGETDQGVTDDAIEIATISDPGGLVPGLNQGLWDGMEAFVGWCNDLGGINGRELKLTLLDGKILNYKGVVLEACDFAFALVGSGGVFDDTGAQEAVDCGLVDVAGITVNAKKAGSDRMFQPVPNPPSDYPVGAGRYLAEQHPESITKAAMLWSNVAVGSYQSSRHMAAYEQLGYDFVMTKTAAVNLDNWGPIVVELKNKDIDYISITSSYEEMVNLQKEMAKQDYRPAIVDLEANFYDHRYLEATHAAGDTADGTTVRSTFWPFEEADANPATKQFLEILDTYTGAEPTLLGAQSFSAGLLFATAAKAAESDLTRERLIAELSKIHEWTSGGLHGTTDPGNGTPSECFILLRIDKGKYVREYPEEGFSCPDDGRVQIDVSKIDAYEPGAKEK